jgi:MFS family permease
MFRSFGSEVSDLTQPSTVQTIPRTRLLTEPFVIAAGLNTAVLFAWNMVTPVLPKYAQTFQIGAAEVGLLISSFAVGRLVVNIPSGVAAEYLGRKRLLLIGTFMVVLFSTLSGLALTFPTLLLLRFLTGLGGGIAITLVTTVIVDLTPAEMRGRSLSAQQGFTLFVSVLGPTLGGFMADWYGLRAPFLVSGVLAFIFGIWTWLRLPETSQPRRRRSKARGEEHAGSFLADARQLTGNLDFMLICLVGFALFFTRFSGQNTLVPLIAYDHAQLSPGQLGLICAVVSLLNVVTIALAGIWADKYGRKRVIVPSLFAIALGLALYGFAGDLPQFLVAAVVYGLATGFGGPSPAVYLADVAPENMRATSIGVYRSAGDSSAFIGPPLTGYLADRFGYGAGMAVNVAVMLIAAVLFGRFARDQRMAARKRSRPAGSSKTELSTP